MALAYNEGIGQIDMNAADLQQRQKAFIRNAPHKMHPSPILFRYLVFVLININLFPRFALWRFFAVTDFVSPQKNDMRIWPQFKKSWQSPRKLMIPAIGFGVAIDKGDHFVVAREAQVV